MSGIGDVLWTTPLLANLRHAYPDARIGYVVRRNSALVLENNPHVDTLHIFEREDLRFQLGFLHRLFKTPYDMSIDVICSPATAVHSVVCRAKDRIGFDFRGRRHLYNHQLSRVAANHGHSVEFNLAVLDYMEIPRVHTELVWIVSEHEKAHAQTVLDTLHVESGAPVVGLVPTGGYESKKWLPEYYAETARCLVERHQAHVLVFWGNEAEQRDAQCIAEKAGKQVHALPKQTLRYTASLLERCTLVIGNDTGPVHIATAVGAYVLALYGPGNEIAQGPWGARAKVLRAPGGKDICCNQLVCTTPGHPCMRDLTPDMVLEEAGKIL